MRFTRVAAAIGAAAILTGVATASAVAATPSCGNGCTDLFSREFGTHRTPNFVADVLRQGAHVGQQMILFRTSDTDPAEDLNASFDGTTDDFFAAGLVSSAVELHYGGQKPVGGLAAGQGGANFFNDPAFELEYTPYGVGSGLCMGVASTAFQNEGVTLQPCGVSSKTVWIVDIGDSPTTLRRGYVPLVNGSDTNFSHPYVLTYPSNGFPTDKPRPQLRVAELTGFTGNFLVPILGTVNDSQLWGADFGVLR